MSIPKTMRAVVVDKVGGPEVLQYQTSCAVPTPKPTEVLVKNTMAGVNFIDVYFRTGTYPSAKPEILGREAVGTIATVGSSVDQSALGIREGDRVAWTNWTGAYAEYVAIPAEKVVKVPEGVSDEDVAGGFLMGLTALSLTEEAYAVKRGDVVLVHAAAGGTGRLFVQVMKSKGATVIGTAGGPEKCKLAKENGADEVIDYKQFPSKEEWLPKALAFTKDGEGFDAVYDGVGKSTADGSLDAVKRKGTIVFFGAASGPVPDIQIKRLQAKNMKAMRPTMTLYLVTRDELTYYSNQFFEYLRSGKLKIEIHKTYALEDVAKAHVDLEGRKTSGKLLIRI